MNEDTSLGIEYFFYTPFSFHLKIATIFKGFFLVFFVTLPLWLVTFRAILGNTDSPNLLLLDESKLVPQSQDLGKGAVNLYSLSSSLAVSLDVFHFLKAWR